jgi:hypothetical protein
MLSASQPDEAAATRQRLALLFGIPLLTYPLLSLPDGTLAAFRRRISICLVSGPG